MTAEGGGPTPGGYRVSGFRNSNRESTRMNANADPQMSQMPQMIQMTG
jgi:hypothetical protein